MMFARALSPACGEPDTATDNSGGGDTGSAPR